MKINMKISLIVISMISFWVVIFFFVLPKYQNNSREMAKNVKPTKMIVKAIGGLRIRALPDIESPKIGLIPNGSEIETFGEILEEQFLDGKKGKWMKIKFGNISGYSFSGFLDTPPDPFYSDFNQEVLNNFKRLLPEVKDIEYDMSKDKRDDKQIGSEFHIVYDQTLGNKRIITISPTQNECNYFGGSVCFNFVLEDNKIIKNDLNQSSFGMPTEFNEEKVTFQSEQGCGGQCDYYLEAWIYEFNFKSRQLIATDSYTSETNCQDNSEPSNECPCSSELKNSKYVYEKSWIVGTNGEIEKIIKEIKNSY